MMHNGRGSAWTFSFRPGLWAVGVELDREVWSLYPPMVAFRFWRR